MRRFALTLSLSLLGGGIFSLCIFSLWAAHRAAAADGAPAAAADEPGFVSLFDGKSLKGWIGDTKGYVVEDGKIVCLQHKGRNLYTAQQYGDFDLRFEFLLTPGANNGVGIRTPPHGNAAYAGMEIQILDDSAPQYKTLHPYQYMGSIYGVVPAERGHLNPVGQWNHEEIIAQGRRIKVVLNGATIVDADLDQAAPGGKTIDGKKHPGLANAQGHIGWLGHDDRVEFRNIRIKSL